MPARARPASARRRRVPGHLRGSGAEGPPRSPPVRRPGLPVRRGSQGRPGGLRREPTPPRSTRRPRPRCAGQRPPADRSRCAGRARRGDRQPVRRAPRRGGALRTRRDRPRRGGPATGHPRRNPEQSPRGRPAAPGREAEGPRRHRPRRSAHGTRRVGGRRAARTESRFPNCLRNRPRSVPNHAAHETEDRRPGLRCRRGAGAVGGHAGPTPERPAA